MEAFYVLLVRSGNYTFLPELYDIFGREATIDFLEIFAGCKLAVPKVEKLEKLAKEAVIYIRIEQSPRRRRFAVVKSLAEEYNTTEDRINKIYLKAKDKFDELGFSVIPKARKLHV